MGDGLVGGQANEQNIQICPERVYFSCRFTNAVIVSQH